MEDPSLGSYIIKKGLSEKQISQLIEYAAEDEGLKYTSDKTRFKDKESFNNFSKEILAYYVLTNKTDDLLGIIWFHDLPIVIPALVLSSEGKAGTQATLAGSRIESGMTYEDYGISFAIRLYAEARGNGLALPFTEEVLTGFKESEAYKNHPHPKIWLSVSLENETAVKLYRKLGFKDLKVDEEHNKLLMVL